MLWGPAPARSWSSNARGLRHWLVPGPPSHRPPEATPALRLAAQEQPRFRRPARTAEPGSCNVGVGTPHAHARTGEARLWPGPPEDHPMPVCTAVQMTPWLRQRIRITTIIGPRVPTAIPI